MTCQPKLRKCRSYLIKMRPSKGKSKLHIEQDIEPQRNIHLFDLTTAYMSCTNSALLTQVTVLNRKEMSLLSVSTDQVVQKHYLKNFVKEGQHSP